ncbi:MAG: RNA polymerase sigma factor [Bacteroidales bacterium]|nr:RNA polymerase sigma factor [Bacteroidales bacterium]
MRSSEFRQKLIPFSSRLFRLAFGLLGNREEAEDTVQEVYLKLWKMRNDLEQYDSLEAFSMSITRNVCLDYLRRKKIERRAYSQSDENNSYDPDPSVKLEIKEKALLINHLISQLPEPQRSLIYYRHIEGKEYKEIEDLVGMKENAIRVSISRARKKLREMLQNQYASWIN